MMRGPSYDDAYITRKMSQLQGPTFAPPAPTYGRPPMGGYMQHDRTTKMSKKEKRSGSPSLPYLWPVVDNKFMERRSKKGWYRVDYGPQKTVEMWYLPTVRDRLNFLQSHAESSPRKPYDVKTAPAPNPPFSSYLLPVQSAQRPRSSSYWATRSPQVKSSQVAPTPRRPRARSTFSSMSAVVPYSSSASNQLWAPEYLTPLAGRARSLSPPIRIASSWSDSLSPYSSSYSATTTYTPEATEVREERRSVSPSRGYRPSGATQLILNRLSLRSPRSSVPPLGRGYPMGPPPPRMPPRMPPAYYDYDYGYGGYGGYGYGYPPPPPPPPRMSRYDTYLEDEMPEPATYVPRFRSRPPTDTFDSVDYRDKITTPHITSTTTTTTPRTSDLVKSYSPGMLQDHVDKMRIKLKSLAYSLDPSGPVPEIIVPERTKKTSDVDKKYSQGPKHLACVEFAGGQPQWKRRARARYPTEDPENVTMICKAEFVDGEETPEKAEKEKEKLIIKDRLSNRIHKFFESTLDGDQFEKYLKTYRQPGPKPRMMPDTTSRYSKLTASKWEEPDTVFGASSDKKPFSKPLTDGTTEEVSEEKKERRKKKKSKEREIAAAAEVEAAPAPVSVTPTPAAPSDISTSEVEAPAAPTESVSAVTNGEAVDEEGLDDKERKKLEKKKRKAEREAAAKAAMEAELAALAAAEAELARLEAESSSMKDEAPAAEVVAPAPEVVAPAVEVEVPAPAEVVAEPTAEVKSESAAEKCESSIEVVCEGVSVTPETLGEPVPPESPLQIPPQEEQECQQVSDEVTEEVPKEPSQVVAEALEVEPQIEEPQVEPQVEEIQVDTQVELQEPQVEPMEEPKVEPQVEDLLESQAEPQVEPLVEPQVEPLVESLVEPQMEPQVDLPAEPETEAPKVEEPAPAVTDATPVEDVSVVDPVVKARPLEDAPWWLSDSGAEEVSVEGAGVEESGQQLGTEAAEDLPAVTPQSTITTTDADAAAGHDGELQEEAPIAAADKEDANIVIASDPEAAMLEE